MANVDVDPNFSPVGSSRYLPSSVLSIIRMGLGIHLLATGCLSIAKQPVLFDLYRWHPLITPLCGLSFMLLALCAALQSAHIKPGLYLSQVATVLHLISSSLAFASLTDGVLNCQVYAIAYVSLDFALGTRLCIRLLHITYPVIVILPLCTVQSISNSAVDLIAVFVASVLMYGVSQADDETNSNKVLHFQRPESTVTTYQYQAV